MGRTPVLEPISSARTTDLVRYVVDVNQNILRVQRPVTQIVWGLGNLFTWLRLEEKPRTPCSSLSSLSWAGETVSCGRLSRLYTE